MNIQLVKEPEWRAKLLEMAADLVRHGHGQMTFSSTVIGGDRRRIEIDAGRRYVFFEPAPLTNAARAA